MKKHLNTLYISQDGAYLHKDGLNIIVSLDNVEKIRAPVHLIGAIVLFGLAKISPPLMGFCASEGITITYLNEYGKFLARVEGAVSGNVLLRRAQYRAGEHSETTARLAAAFIGGKILNQRSLLRRHLRDYGDNNTVEQAALSLHHSARLSQKPAPLETLRGIEGEAAARYFSVFNQLIRHEGFVFTTRSRRPPLDAVNALLSLIYTLLTHDCRSSLESVGLDPASGFLHALRPGRPSLALDLMEELRAPLADRLVLSLINRRQVTLSDFNILENGAVLLKDEARKTVLLAWQNRKKEKITHPYLEEELDIGLIPFVQAQLLARHLRGDLESYPPMIWK